MLSYAELTIEYPFFLLPAFFALLCYNLVSSELPVKADSINYMLKNKLDTILPFRWADRWSNSARSVKEGVYMNHFKFSDTLGGYSLRYQKPISRERGKEVGINYWSKTCVFQFKMNSVIYFAGNQSQNK